MGTRSEILSAASRLHLGEFGVRQVPDGAARALLTELERQFTGAVGATWWWERFVGPSAALEVSDGNGYLLLTTLVPDALASVWLVAEDEPEWIVLETTATAAQAILGECSAFEYYLIAHDRSWLLCENHHNVMIGVGDAVCARITATSNKGMKLTKPG